jgi:hypothetical protein
VPDRNSLRKQPYDVVVTCRRHEKFSIDLQRPTAVTRSEFWDEMRTKYQAAIFRHGPAAKGAGVDEDGIAWWLESYARCDIAKFPDQIAEDRGWEIRTGPDGLRQPIHLINSRRGTDCVADARFLEIGTGKPSGKAPTQYVANAGQFTDFLNEPSRPHVRLPLDAVASPYHHGSEALVLPGSSPRLHRHRPSGCSPLAEDHTVPRLRLTGPQPRS